MNKIVNFAEVQTVNLGPHSEHPKAALLKPPVDPIKLGFSVSYMSSRVILNLKKIQ